MRRCGGGGGGGNGICLPSPENDDAFVRYDSHRVAWTVLRRFLLRAVTSTEGRFAENDFQDCMARRTVVVVDEEDEGERDGDGDGCIPLDMTADDSGRDMVT